MRGENAFADGAQIQRRLQVAPLIQRVRRKSRPVGDHASARDGAAEQECAARSAVIRAARAVDRDRPSELRDDEDRRASPGLAKREAQAFQSLIKTVQPIGELPALGALIRVCIPASALDDGDTRSIRGRQELSGSAATMSMALSGLRLPDFLMPASATSSAANAVCSRVANHGSFAYRSATRCSVSESASGSRDGAHEFTRASPRSTSGRFWESAMAIVSVVRSCRTASAGSNRLSQPSCAPLASTVPFSSRS